MKLIRNKCRGIIKSNRNSINMDTISTRIKSTSVSLPNYAGSIRMNQSTKLNAIRNEYYQTIKLLSPSIHHLSITSMMHFHGYKHLDHIRDQLNLKSFSKLIRTHTNNGLHIILPQIKDEWHAWTSKHGITFNPDNPTSTLNKYNRYNFTLHWYITAKRYNISDINMMQYGQILPINSLHYVPPDIPKWIQFVPYTNEWHDCQMNDKDLYIFTDAAIYYEDDNPDPNSKIHGYGGGAVVAYHKHKEIKKWLYPVTSRSHINTMEMYQILKIFEIISNDESLIPSAMSNKANTSIEIHIISDSQNSLNILKQSVYPKDDALIYIQKQINAQIIKIDAKKTKSINIILHWVKSHDKSDYNQSADGYAKIAALLVRNLSNYYSICRCNQTSQYQHFLSNTPSKKHNKTKCTCI